MQKEQIKITVEGFKISNMLAEIICQEINHSEQTDWRYVVLNFRDPDYSAQLGGFHPVEIFIDCDGIIKYITDFSFFGPLDMAELGKDIDFDFGSNAYLSCGYPISISEGRGLYRLWEGNFCEYYKMGVYNVSKEFN